MRESIKYPSRDVFDIHTQSVIVPVTPIIVKKNTKYEVEVQRRYYFNIEYATYNGK